MRRTILLVAATVIGLSLLLTFRSTPIRGSAAGFPAGTVSGPAGNPTGPGERVITGPAMPTMFGAVQVRIDLTGKRVSDIQAVQLPSDFALSRQISAIAGPILRREALKAQSARIDAVSGASYTSSGYKQSLQAALDRAGY